MRSRVIPWLVVGLAAGAASSAVAGDLDPDVPHEVFVGTPPGPAPAVPRRPPPGATREALPSSPKVSWRRELEIGLDVAPLVMGDGGVVVALSSAEVLRLDPAGKEVWRRSLGAAPPSVAPVRTSDGGILVLTGDGGLWRLTAGGALAFRKQLGWDDANDVVAPLARDDGSVVLAGASAAMVMDARGKITAQTALGDPPAGRLLAWRDGVLWVTRGGDVTWWRPPRRPRRLGGLNGAIFDGGPILASDRTLVAVTDRSSVVAFDLLGRRATTLLDTVASVQLDGTATMTTDDTLLVTSMVGELVGLDPKGMMARRQALDPAALLAAAAGAGGGKPVFRRYDRAPSPPLLSDAAGRIVFLRSDGRFGVIPPGGNPSTVEAQICPRPVALVPAGPRRVLVTCRLGTLVMLADPPVSAPSGAASGTAPPAEAPSRGDDPDAGPAE